MLTSDVAVNVRDKGRMFFNVMLPGEKIKNRRISFENKVVNYNSLLYYSNTCPNSC